MALETVAILRVLLFDAMMGEAEDKDIGYIIRAISAMCSKDDVAAVKEQVAEQLKKSKKQ